MGGRGVHQGGRAQGGGSGGELFLLQMQGWPGRLVLGRKLVTKGGGTVRAEEGLL